ncbi:hypothetical protein ACHAC9_22380 [Massilia sp. CMS3.1]|uniref:DUF4376 domain-containing protein n=1 Tax=Massilia sp. CMS3.1 TaxID=3373083 RepID=UPI003EE5436B
MAISRKITADNGASIEYHKPFQLVVNLAENVATVTINSYASEQAALDSLPIAQQWRVAVPTSLLAGDQPTIAAEIEHALTSDPASPLSGGTVVIDRTLTLAEAKTRKRAEITRARLSADSDHFKFGERAIRTADKDIVDLLIADARWRKGKPINWPGGWKTMDDSDVPISTVAEWDTFFCAMYDAGINNFQRSQALKNQLAVATTPEQVAAITW